MLTFAQYESLAASTAVYPPQAKGLYPLLGLLGEAAELAAKLVDNDPPRTGPDGILLGDIEDALHAAYQAGEWCERLKKLVRGTRPEVVEGLLRNARHLSAESPEWPAAREGVSREVGDVLWYLAALCRDYGLTLADCAEGNLAKLKLRHATGTLHGSGDDRELAAAV